MAPHITRLRSAGWHSASRGTHAGSGPNPRSFKGYRRKAHAIGEACADPATRAATAFAAPGRVELLWKVSTTIGSAHHANSAASIAVYGIDPGRCGRCADAVAPRTVDDGWM